MQNSIAAGASRILVTVTADRAADRLRVKICDNGRGMSPEMLERVGDPFVTTRTTRNVGLGIPLLTAAAEACEGRLEMDSTPGVGTTLLAEFRLGHIDRAPFGDIDATVITTVIGNPEVSFRYEQVVDGRAFVLDTDEINSRLDGVPITDPAVAEWMRGFIREGIERID
ncbi:MAG: ATP-binding protein [Armatimonadota bacterium]